MLLILKLLKKYFFLKLKLGGRRGVVMKYKSVLVLSSAPREQIIPSEILEVSYWIRLVITGVYTFR